MKTIDLIKANDFIKTIDFITILIFYWLNKCSFKTSTSI